MRYFCSVFTTFFPDPILKPARGHLSDTHSSTVAIGSPYLRKLPCVSGCTRLVGSQPLVLKPSVNLCFQTTLPLQQQVPMINVCYFCKCVFNATGHLHKLFAHFVNSRLWLEQKKRIGSPGLCASGSPGARFGATRRAEASPFSACRLAPGVPSSDQEGL